MNPLKAILNDLLIITFFGLPAIAIVLYCFLFEAWDYGMLGACFKAFGLVMALIIGLTLFKWLIDFRGWLNRQMGRLYGR